MSELVVVERRDRIAIVRLGGTEDKLPILTPARMEALARVVRELKTSDLRAAIFTGVAEAGFCGGADVQTIREVTDPKVGAEFARLGQVLFNEIEQLPFPTIAAITGPCVGGGCELVLACSYRILADSAESKIGLPEIKLGILPGFGGTQRLPRLIGLPKALDVILAGKVLRADQALRVGLIDELVGTPGGSKGGNFHAVVTRAEEIANSGKIPKRRAKRFVDRLLTSTGIGRSLVKPKALAGIQKETQGFYPAPVRALEVALLGLRKGTTQGYEAEAIALGELIATPVSKNLVHLFLLTEAASKLGKSARSEVVGAKIAVLGGGVMGAGIAVSFLQRGYSVTILEPVEAAQVRAQAHVERAMQKRSKGSAENLKQFRITDTLDDLAGSSVVIEAIVEDLAIKQSVFSQLSKLVAPTAILASNTSSLSLDAIAEQINDPSRFLGIHFFNPAEKMPLVEIVHSKQSSERAIVFSAALASSLGKHPVVVRDVPGFLVNRVLSAYIAESGQLLAEGHSIEAIDSAATGFGMPMGPFRMLDEVGLDVAAKVQEVLTSAYGERMTAPEYPKKLVAQSRFGKKSGGGFYNYRDGTPESNPEVYGLLGIAPPHAVADSALLADRLTLSLINEAVGCLDEGVAGAPGAEAAGQIDLATVMGMGFAPFRGGVIRYAESLGVVEVLHRLQKLPGVRFKPAAGIIERAERGLSFYEPLS